MKEFQTFFEVRYWQVKITDSDHVFAVLGTYGIWIISDILKIEHVRFTRLKERNFLFGCLS